jgi:hypothetical protein
MAQDNEHVQRLIAARDGEVARRRAIAERLAEKHDRGDTENIREAFIGSEKRTMKPGDVAVIPGGVEHEGYFPEGSEVIDFFAPVRQDFLTGEPPPYMTQR